MKKLLIVLLILLTGCTDDSIEVDNNEITIDDNLLGKYLEDNHYSFNSNEKDALEALKIYKENFDKSSLILLGENHNVDKNFELSFLFIKYILKEYGEVVYVGEFGYSQGLQFNEYLKTGDTKILNDIFHGIKGTAADNKEHYDFWVYLYNYINNLPDNNVTVIGLDIEHSMKSSVEYLQDLVIKNVSEEDLDLFDFIFKIDEFIEEDREYDSTEYHLLFDNVIADYKNYLNDSSTYVYKSTLGDFYFDFNMITKGIVDSYDAYFLYKREGLSYPEFAKPREEAIYQNFLKLYDMYEDKHLFGSWGDLHTDLYCNNAAGFGNASSMATRINNDSKISGKVFSIRLWYNNIQLRERYDIKLTSDAIKLAKDDYTIFKLDEDNTVFKKLSNEQIDCSMGFKLDYPDEVGVLDHFQSVIIVNNAKNTSELILD